MLRTDRGAPPGSPSLRPLPRKEFYELTVVCRDYATELARFDPRRVNLQQCYRFNVWLNQLRAYAPLEPRLRTMKNARPVTRWQLGALLLAVWFVAWLGLMGRADRMTNLLLLNGLVLLFILLWMLPERIYGTTVEMIEGKVLRIVESLEEILLHGNLGLTEAVFFRAKQNLEQAHAELREQLDLAHRD